MRAGRLRCEYLTAPEGIDATTARLSWELVSPQRGARQTAWQVLVASSPERLARGEGDLWDSGKVRSDRTAQIEYQGKPLISRQRCYWKVRVWNEKDQPTAWSAPTRWSMGLLDSADWKGEWIGKSTSTAPPEAFDTPASWIWSSPPDGDGNQPVGTSVFRTKFSISSLNDLASARLRVVGDNTYNVFLNGRTFVLQGDDFRVGKDVPVTAFLENGENVLEVVAANLSGPAGLLGELALHGRDGSVRQIVTDRQWQAAHLRTKEEKKKRTFDDCHWQGVHRLGSVGMAPWGKPQTVRDDRRIPSPMLRKEFDCSEIRRATAYICGLGYYELHLNGRKVGDHVLDPVLTDYSQRVTYVVYDVTDQIQEGRNAVGILLGSGHFHAPRLKFPVDTRDFGQPRVRFQLHLEMQDGSEAVVTTDQSWKATTAGPIRWNNVYDGECYDARREMPGWASTQFDDTAWTVAETVAAPAGKPVAQMMPPMRVVKQIQPVSITEQAPGVWIFDMGQNLVGWCRLKAQGPAGTLVRLRHAETLKPDGHLFTANLRGARSYATYTLMGQGKETYEPRFTYFGFRYVELTGLAGKPDRDTLEACIVNTDLPEAGTFACSHPLLNQIHNNAKWGIQGNYRSIPTDCPQRDERHGWQGDRAAESLGETYLFDNVTFYSKWMTDVRDSQRPDGNVSDVCPNYWEFYNPNATWPASWIIASHGIYEQYGDRRILRKNYDGWKRWLAFIDTLVEDGIFSGDNYGDWCVPPAEPELIHAIDPARITPKPFIAAAYHVNNYRLVSQAAALLGKQDEATVLEQRFEQLKKNFIEHFWQSDQGYFANGTQSSCTIPLAFDLVRNPSQGESLFLHLSDHIETKSNGYIQTGLLGGQWLMRSLSDHGRPDLAFRIAMNTAYPSWGYMVEHGATTIWELWNGDTADIAMNSGNHVMLLGDLITWYYGYLAGIRTDPAQPGFKHLLMKPHRGGNLQFVKATYHSIRGPISSHWEEKDNAFRWQIALPANTSATVYVPTTDAGSITESGKPLEQLVVVKFVRVEENHTVLTVASGTYDFRCSLR